MLRPQNQPLHQAPSTRLGRGTVSRDTVTTGRGAPALLLLWRRGSPRILAARRWPSHTHAHPGAAAPETEGVKPESLGRRSEPRRSGPSSLYPQLGLPFLGAKMTDRAWPQACRPGHHPLRAGELPPGSGGGGWRPKLPGPGRLRGPHRGPEDGKGPRFLDLSVLLLGGSYVQVGRGWG